MKYAIFRCCITAKHLPEYETSTDSLLKKLGISVMSIPEFGCCGYPLKDVSIYAALTVGARNLTLAENAGAAILTVCSCCYGTLRHALRLLEDQAVRREINKSLAKEGLEYKGHATVRHLFHLLGDDDMIESIKSRASADPKKVALQYGCKLLRPSLSTMSGDPFTPDLFRKIMAAAGYNVVETGSEAECCGSPIAGADDIRALRFSAQKVVSAHESGAKSLVAVCPFCRLHLEKEEGRA
jgi:heterodisulfide reductase subunit B